MIKYIIKELYSDATRIIAFDEDENLIFTTQAKSTKRLFNQFTKRIGKEFKADNIIFKIYMNNNILLSSKLLDNRRLIEGVFAYQYQGDGIFAF